MNYEKMSRDELQIEYMKVYDTTEGYDQCPICSLVQDGKNPGKYAVNPDMICETHKKITDVIFGRGSISIEILD